MTNENMIMGTASYTAANGMPVVEKHLDYNEFFELHPSPTVTVAELIAMLQQYPADMIVCRHDEENDGEYSIHEVRQGVFQEWVPHYAGEGGERYLVAIEIHVCDVVVID